MIASTLALAALLLAMYLALRLHYPRVVGLVAVLSVVAAPQSFSAAWHGWGREFLPTKFTLGPHLALMPEWHLVFALFGIVAAIRRRHTDPVGLYMMISMLLLIMLLPIPAKPLAFAPLIGLGAGRMLYRGTLTRTFRIPPATWGIILLAIAAIRSTVILVVWAPQWEDYRNRVALLLEGSKRTQSQPHDALSIERN